MNFFCSQEEIAAHLGKADERMKDQEDLLRTLDLARSANEKEMDRLYRLYMDEGISRDSFSSKFGSLEKRQKQIGEESPALQAELDLVKIYYLSSEEIITEAKDLYTRWPSLRREEKRHIVEEITERIVIGKDDVDIALNYLPSSAPLNHGRMATPEHGFMAAISWNRAG